MAIAALAGTSKSFVLHRTTSIGAPARPPAISSSLTLKGTRAGAVYATGGGADHQRRLKGNPPLLALAPVIATVVARTEKDSGPRRAFDLPAIVADVDLSGFWIFREPVRRRRKRRAIIAWGRDGHRELTQSCFLHQRRAR